MTFKTMKCHSCIVLVMLISILMFDLVEMSGKINFEKVNNYVGETVIFYDQEIDGNSTNTTSYEVTSRMTCRRIKNARQSSEKPLNLVSVGTLENGTIVCKVAYQDISLLKLSPKIGMITFLDKPNNDLLSLRKSGIFYWAPRGNNRYHPSYAYTACTNNWELANAITPTLKGELKKFMTEPRADIYLEKSGIFYTAPVGVGKTNPSYAFTSCMNNWEPPNIITPTLKDKLEKFMAEMGFSDTTLNATCSTVTSNASWNDGTPFNYTVMDATLYGPYVVYQKLASGGERFQCSHNWDAYSHIVCMVNIYSYPWTEF